MRRQLAALLAFALATATLSAQGQDATASPPWLARLSSYLEAINEHTPGRLDPAARFTGSLGEVELDALRTDFFALVFACKRALNRPARPASIAYHNSTIPLPEIQKRLGLNEAEAAQGNANRILLRAAILHADTAILLFPSLAGRAGCHERAAPLLVKDGKVTGDSCLGFHWTHGRLLLDAVTPDPGRDAAVRRWYIATVTYMLEKGDYASADLHIARARQVFPDDPAILFEHGYYHEAFAAPFTQTAALEAGIKVRGAIADLEEAEKLYGRAIRREPRFMEARVHRGRVLGLLGRDQEAAEELRLALPSVAGSKDRYFAELFIGDAEASVGNSVAAHEHYRQAAALYPRAQSPLLALALLARQLGDRAGERDAMRQLLALPPARNMTADPWWLYHRRQTVDYRARLIELYAPFLDGGRQ
jgi:tetratricopeptide (TPR) repeat protein